MKYKTLVLLTCHEARECVLDTVKNIFLFNKDTCIVINNGIYNDNLDDVKSEHVHIVNRKVMKDWIWSLIPYHIEMWDYIIEHNIQAEYVVMLSSNQSFVRHGFYDFMKNYKAGYFARQMVVETVQDFQCNCHQNDLMNNDRTFCNNILNDIGKENFIHQSNHDGMFYTWEVYFNMMKYFENHRGMPIRHHSEEFLYIAYLIKHIPKTEMAEYSEYNYHSLMHGFNPLTIEAVNIAIDKGMYFVKRVHRVYDDPARVYIRSLS